MTYRPLRIQEAEFIAHSLAVELMNDEHEPIPAFHTRSPGKLESCLAEPFQTYDGKYLHYHFVRRVALLFYLVTKNHCFSNGNKRMAVTLTMVFCYINKKWMNIRPEVLYAIANNVAKSHARDKDEIVNMLTRFFKDYLVEYPTHKK